ALTKADEVVVLGIYAAREDPEPGVTAELITERIGHDRVYYRPDRDAAVECVVSVAQPGDIVLTMGAGDVTELRPRIVEALGEAGAGAGAAVCRRSRPPGSGGRRVTVEERSSAAVSDEGASRPDPWQAAFIILLVSGLVGAVLWVLF